MYAALPRVMPRERASLANPEVKHFPNSGALPPRTRPGTIIIDTPMILLVLNRIIIIIIIIMALL